MAVRENATHKKSFLNLCDVFKNCLNMCLVCEELTCLKSSAAVSPKEKSIYFSFKGMDTGKY